MTMLSRILRPAAVLATAAVLVTAAPAAADTAPGGGQAALAEQYGSLSGALLGYYATSSNQTLADYLAGAGVLLDPAGGQAPASPTSGAPATSSLDPSAPAAPTASGAAPAVPTSTSSPSASSPAGGGDAATLAQLNSSLASAGLTLDVRGYTTLAQLAAGVSARAGTPDGAVALAGAQWASQLAGLYTPTLSAPGASMPGVPQVPAGALAFGLFLNNSVTSLIADHPDVFAQVSRTGLGTPAATAAWNSSMMSALSKTQTDIASVMPDQCAAGMLSVMASGNTASAGRFSCGQDCRAGGLYLHAQAQRLFDQSGTSTIPDPTAAVWSNGTYAGLQDWQRAAITAQNPSLTGQLNQSMTGTGGVCTTAATATSSALSTALPGVFSQLTPR